MVPVLTFLLVWLLLYISDLITGTKRLKVVMPIDVVNRCDELLRQLIIRRLVS